MSDQEIPTEMPQVEGAPMTEEEQLALLMGQLEQSVEEAPEPEFDEDQGKPISPVLEGLDPSRRPCPGTVCESCPNSVWLASLEEVKCYCRVMFLVTCSTKEPNMLIACDGMFLGQEEG